MTGHAIPTVRDGRFPWGGCWARIVLESQGLEAVWPHLWAGQWLHVGKGAMMGLGQYALEALN